MKVLKTEQELKELREAVKAANPSGNPMMPEAIMRSRLKALQLKRQEKVFFYIFFTLK